MISCQAVAEQVGELFTCSQVNHYIRIRTPFLYPDGDVIDVFLKETIGGGITITDVGETLRWLRMQTVVLKRSKKQNALIEDVLMTHGVERFKGTLVTRVESNESLGEAVIRLSQTMLRVSDLWFTLRNQSFTSIIDEVEEYLLEERIRFDRNVKIIGRSTRTWNIDFQTYQPERSAFISVLSTSNTSAAQSLTNAAVARWIDLSSYKVSQGTKFISLFDDTTEVWQDHNFRMLEDLSDIVLWSRPDELRELLVGDNLRR